MVTYIVTSVVCGVAILTIKGEWRVTACAISKHESILAQIFAFSSYGSYTKSICSISALPISNFTLERKILYVYMTILLCKNIMVDSLIRTQV